MTRRSVAAGVTWVFLAGAFIAAAGPATGPATRPADALVRAWPGGSYDLLAGGQRAGRVAFRTEVVRRDGGELLQFADVFELPAAGGRIVRSTVTTVCRPDEMLTPLRVAGGGDRPGEGLAAVDLRFEGGVAVGTVRGRPTAAAAASPVVTELALFRLVTLLPRREGAEIKFNLFQSTEARSLGETTLRCAGRERIGIAGRAYDAWRFDHTGPGIRPSAYWVNADGYFLRATLAENQEWVYAPKP